jgi:hypothetical protein
MRLLAIVTLITAVSASPGIMSRLWPEKDKVAYPPALQTKSGPLIVPPNSYQPPKPTDARSPCPFLNTAANHGILPRDGRNIPLPVIYRLLRKTGFDRIGANSRISATRRLITHIKEKLGKQHADDTIDLDEYGVHGPIEHEASLTRNNTRTPQTADDRKPNLALVEGLLALAVNTPSDPVKRLGLAQVANWRFQRYRDEKKREELFALADKSIRPVDFGFKAQLLAASECTNLLYVLGRNGVISVDQARSFLVEEKFPDDWTAPTGLYIWRMETHMAACASAVWMSQPVFDMIAEKAKSTVTPWLEAFRSILD